MSGTSMDGIDASIVTSDGVTHYEAVYNKYFEYNDELYENLTVTRDKINASEDLKTLSTDLKALEREITLFHAEVVNEILKETNVNIDFLGFHGQTIFHNSEEKISKQLGDGNLLSQLTRKVVIYDFRKNDLLNGGQGAPLTPIFHKMIASNFNRKFKIKRPIFILNIGGISNLTQIQETQESSIEIFACDIGPGNCLIDEWIRKNSKKKYDNNGLIAKSGKINKLILNQALENFSFESTRKSSKKISLDTKDFDISFIRGLSLEDGAATLTEYTATTIVQGLLKEISNFPRTIRILLCGGGRKNEYLIDSIIKKGTESLRMNKKSLNEMLFEPIDKYDVDGDFIESQAFAYLAIRSYLELPISFPYTTGCKNKFGCTGGVLVKNY
jgi:anhydro-N-acetylmuramic acid kinase